MFSYGSRVGVTGRRGHGGYQPPRRPNRRRGNNNNVKTPPPVKECGCMIQIKVEEYCQATMNNEPRQHRCFLDGRNGMEVCQKTLRKDYGSHLLIPGKRQKGTISILSSSQEQALPAVHWLLSQMNVDDDYDDDNHHHHHQVEGIIHYTSTDVQQKKTTITWNGYFSAPPSNNLFLSPSSGQSVVVYALPISNDDDDDDDGDENIDQLFKTLEICIDNVKFRLGPTQGLSFFISHPYAYAMGPSNYLKDLFEEVDKAMATRNNSDNCTTNVKGDK